MYDPTEIYSDSEASNSGDNFSEEENLSTPPHRRRSFPNPINSADVSTLGLDQEGIADSPTNNESVRESSQVKNMEPPTKCLDRVCDPCVGIKFTRTVQRKTMTQASEKLEDVHVDLFEGMIKLEALKPAVDQIQYLLMLAQYLPHKSCWN